MQHNYISPAGLDNLKHYRYHCIDRSLVAKYIGQPFWRWAVELLPRTIAYVCALPFTTAPNSTMSHINTNSARPAPCSGVSTVRQHLSCSRLSRPNLITLSGFALMVLSFTAISLSCPLLKGEAHPLVYLLMSVCLFIYQQLDALDGKQVSSPLSLSLSHAPLSPPARSLPISSLSFPLRLIVRPLPDSPCPFLDSPLSLFSLLVFLLPFLSPCPPFVSSSPSPIVTPARPGALIHRPRLESSLTTVAMPWPRWYVSALSNPHTVNISAIMQCFS